MVKRGNRLSCAVVGCPNAKNSEVQLFCFPRNVDVCRKWLEFCQSPHLVDKFKTGYDLASRYRVCGLHFPDSAFQNYLRIRLLRKAVPTLYGPGVTNFIGPVLDVPNVTVRKSACNVSHSADSIHIKSKPHVTDSNSGTVAVHDPTVSPPCSPVNETTPDSPDFSESHSLLDEHEDFNAPNNWKASQNYVDRKKIAYQRKQRKDSESKKLMDICRRMKDTLESIYGLKCHKSSVNSVLMSALSPSLVDFIKSLLRRCQRKSMNSKSFSNLLSTVCFSTGVSQPVLDSISNSLINRKDRLCILLFAEMPIREHYDYEPSSDIILGFEDLGDLGRSSKPAKFALIFMAHGLLAKWVQPLATYFTGNRIKPKDLTSIIKIVLEKSHEVGLNVIAVICEPDPNEREAIKMLGATVNKPFFLSQERKIVTLYDPSSLLLSTRNVFLHNDVVVPVRHSNAKYLGKASWRYVRLAFTLDKEAVGFQMMPQVTKSHINPHDKEKKNIQLAAQVFSHCVAAYLMHEVRSDCLPFESIATACFLKFVYNMFNSVNSWQYKSCGCKQADKNDKTRVMDPEFWRYARREVKRWRFLKKKTSSNEKTLVLQHSCQNGWIVTLKGIQIVYAKLKKKLRKIGGPPPISFNLDPLRDFFGCIRNYSLSSGDPTVISFMDAWKACMLSGMAFVVPGVNFHCNDARIVENSQTSSKKDRMSKNDICTAGADCVVDPTESSTCSDQKESILRNISVTSTASLCGLIARRVILKYECNPCRTGLCSSETEDFLMSGLYYGRYKEMDDTIFPSESLIKSVSLGITLTEEMLGGCAHEVGVVKTVKCVLKKEINLNWLEQFCEDHSDMVAEDILSAIVLMTISWWCKKRNKLLVLKKEESYENFTKDS